MTGPLRGVRVLDTSRVLSGPYATMILADMGAEVIKIELPRTGDEARGIGPFKDKESTYFISINRGKKSVTLDMRKREGAEILAKLARKCDVLVENFTPGTMKKFGLDYESLKGENPRLIYTSISGFGQTGPYSERPAYDAIIQGMGGIASLTGREGDPPVRVGTSIGDLGASMYAVVGVVSALYAREFTGVGQHIDIAMLDCQVSLLENAIARYSVNGEVPKPLGSRHPTITPFEFLQTKDGYIVIAAGNNMLWAKLCEVLGLPHLIEDKRFRTNADRTDNYEELRPILAQSLLTKTSLEWEEMLHRANVPCGPINTIDKVVEDEHVRARGMILESEHKKIGKLKVAGSPLKFSEDRVEITDSAPLLGEHTDEVLKNIADLSDEKIADLKKKKVI